MQKNNNVLVFAVLVLSIGAGVDFYEGRAWKGLLIVVGCVIGLVATWRDRKRPVLTRDTINQGPNNFDPTR